MQTDDALTASPERTARERWRARVFAILHKPDPDNHTARGINIALAVLIVVNAAAVAFESSHGKHDDRLSLAFALLEVGSTFVFAIEYLLRVWTCVEQRHLSHPVKGRLRFALQPLALLDLIVVITHWTPWDMRFLRVVRLVRLLKVLHLHDLEGALQRLSQSLRRRSELLIVAVVLMLMCVYVASGLLYQVEHARQPEVFSSIPATFWWASVAFTSVGYGDMVPLTIAGRICAAFVTVFGIGIFALPAAIVTAAIIEASAVIEHSHERDEHVCEACGHRNGHPNQDPL